MCVCVCAQDILLLEHYELKCVLPSSPADGNSIDSFCVFSKGFFIGCEEGTLTLYEPSDDRVELYKATKTFPIRGNLAHINNMVTRCGARSLAAQCRILTITLSLPPPCPSARPRTPC